MFVDRKQELEALERLWRSRGAQLVVVYGRRRVGKTELLRRFAAGRLCVYFVAAQTREQDNLNAFTAELRRAFSDPLLDRGPVPDWEAGLEFLAAQARRRRVLVVLDEFQYLCQGNSSLPSLVQRFWDGPGLHSRLFLVLCGSHVSFMQRELLAERAPLFGRRTGQLQVTPFEYRESGCFLGQAAAAEKMAAYAVFGGTPAYLARWQPSRTLRQNVTEQILRPESPLYDEVAFLLRTELSETRTYSSILGAIAAGFRRPAEIGDRVGMERVAVGKYLSVLRELGLVRRETPITEAASHGGRRGRYVMADNYLRFWYRFVLPNLSPLEAGRAAMVYDTVIAPALHSYVGRVFEVACAQFLMRADPEEWVPCRRVGRHWSPSVEIDILTENLDGSHYVGECKWSSRPVGVGVVDRLAAAVEELPAAFQKEVRFVVFSRRGFTNALRERARKEGIRLVTVEEMYGS